MGREIERKYLVKNNLYRNNFKGVLYRQAYLNNSPERTVRVRVYNQKGYLTIKGPTEGCVRAEFEYGIPFNEAQTIIDSLCEKPVIEKYRYKVEYEGLIWEIDEFIGDNTGLVIAEIELSDENQSFLKPSWIGEEVTGDQRYYNSNLVKKPFCTWTERTDNCRDDL